jgi:hypothetical protein
MSNTSLEIIHEGWLTKSPPSKAIWRAVRTVSSIFHIYKDTKGHKVRGIRDEAINFLKEICKCLWSMYNVRYKKAQLRLWL